MRSLRHPWLWPLCSAAAVILLLLLAAGAARFYPAGILEPHRDDRFTELAFVVVPLPDIVPDVEETPEPEPEEDRPPPPEPDVFRNLWDGWVAGRAVEVMNGPTPPDSVIVLAVPQLTWEQLFHTPADTTAEGVLARSGLMWEQRVDGLRAWGRYDNAMKQAARYHAMKKSVFNEDWLSSEHLK